MCDHPWEIDFGYWLGPIYAGSTEERAGTDAWMLGCILLLYIWLKQNQDS